LVENPGPEPWVERVIREAQEQGTLDVTEGAGKPIPGLSRPYDPAWWARNWVAAERSRERSVEVAHTVEQALPRVLARMTVADVRKGLESLNATIAEHNYANPHNPLPMLDADRLISERSPRRRQRH
jgi:hypothetical protein